MTTLATPRLAVDSMPNTESVASLPRDERRSAKKMAKWFWEQYETGLTLRKPHAINWIKVKSIMRGIHYFQISRNGAWRPLKPKTGQIWAAVPHMKPYFRHELGRLNSNVLGVSTFPASGDVRSIQSAERTYNILTHWIDEVDLQSVFDRGNQMLLYEGMVGYYRYADRFRGNVFIRPLPASELFPIPYDAKDFSEIDGLMHVTLVTEQWLEQQDNIYEVQHGQPPQRSMKKAAKKHTTSMSIDFPILGSGASMGGKMQGALAITTWMKPTEFTPGGEYSFMLGDEMFRYRAGTDPQTGESLAMPGGVIPVEPVYYTKQPDDFWGYGFCEDAIAMQLAINRQMTNVEMSSKMNKGITMYDTDSVDAKDVQVEHDAWIPYRSSAIGSPQQQPVVRVPPANVGRDVGATLGLIQQYADQAVGYRSGVIFGQQEGRTEGGPATSLLNTNAQSPLTPVLSRIYDAFRKTYPAVLDMLRTVWPKEKTVRISGPNNVGKELTLQRDQIPWSRDVIIEPVPFLPNGTNTLANILFELKQIPGQDGTIGSAVNDTEFLESLQAMGLLPPKIDRTDDPGVRLQSRINRLINDGVTPAVRPADPADPKERMILENHALAVNRLREVILHDSWNTYSKQVQGALLQEFKYHKDFLAQSFDHPQAFNDDIEQFDAAQLENFLAAAEADLETLEGEFSEDGVPVGLEL